MDKCTRRCGFSLVELLIVVAIVVIITAISTTNLHKSRIYAQETAAMRHISAIHVAQAQFYAQYGRFASNLLELGPPASGGSNASAADLLPAELAQGTKGGYQFSVQSSNTGYTVNANPVTYQISGRRTFFSDQTLVLRESPGPEPATVTSPAR